MAWWDHEELKNLEYRSYRYKFAFPGEYSTEDQKRFIDKILNGADPDYVERAWRLACRLGYKPRIRVKALTKTPTQHPPPQQT